MNDIDAAIGYLCCKREQVRLDFNKKSLRDIRGEPLIPYDHPILFELTRMIDYLQTERAKTLCLANPIRLSTQSVDLPTALGAGWSG